VVRTEVRRAARTTLVAAVSVACFAVDIVGKRRAERVQYTLPRLQLE
jgi:hypothetical protein